MFYDIVKFWGDGSQASKDAVEEALKHVRWNAGSIDFNWTFIFILAVVFYVYWTEIKNKNYKAVVAGLSLYGVHWLYEIVNAIICKIFGYPLWTVSAGSSTFILLIGVAWELSMMFALAGIISWKMLPDDLNKKMFAFGKFKGIDCKLAGALGMALMFAIFEIFLGATPAFIWVYKWWGFLPVFITTYIPFFLASNFVPTWKPKTQKIFLISLWGLVALLLAILIPCGVI